MPITVRNFVELCNGDHGTSHLTRKPLKYDNTPFHEVFKDIYAVGGDITLGNGRGGESIYGPTFNDENFMLTHSVPFLLTMVN